MSDPERLTAEQLLIALGRELRKQTGILERIRAARGPRHWEYLVVHVVEQREGWFEYHANGYRLEGLDNKAIYIVLNALGEQGWELVGAAHGDFYFKRPHGMAQPSER
jgi:hypothetical protein